jgi:hypothetical protein
MCFNKEATLAFTLFSCAIAGWILAGKGMWNIPGGAACGSCTVSCGLR